MWAVHSCNSWLSAGFHETAKILFSLPAVNHLLLRLRWNPFSQNYSLDLCCRGWSGGAKVLGKLPVLGRPTNLDDSRARAYCACSRCGWGLFGHFFFHLLFLFSFSLSLGETARYRLKYCLKGLLSPKTTNQPMISAVTQIVWPQLLYFSAA